MLTDDSDYIPKDIRLCHGDLYAKHLIINNNDLCIQIQHKRHDMNNL